MSKNVTPDQRRRIVEELDDIATKLKTDRDHPTKKGHAIGAFNRACAQAGHLCIAAIDAGFLPDDSGPVLAWNLYNPKPSTDREVSFFWTADVAPWARRNAKPGHIGMGAGKFDFPHYKRNKSGKLIDAKGKPLKLVKWSDLENPDPQKRGWSGGRLEGEPAAIEDDYDDVDQLRHIRYRIDDLVHDCKTLGRYLQSEIPEEEPLSDTEQAVFDLIVGLPKGKGITGKEICNKVSGLGPSTLTRHIIPKIKRRGVRNRRGVGYFIAQ